VGDGDEQVNIEVSWDCDLIKQTEVSRYPLDLGFEHCDDSSLGEREEGRGEDGNIGCVEGPYRFEGQFRMKMEKAMPVFCLAGLGLGGGCSLSLFSLVSFRSDQGVTAAHTRQPPAGSCHSVNTTTPRVSFISLTCIETLNNS